MGWGHVCIRIPASDLLESNLTNRNTVHPAQLDLSPKTAPQEEEE